MICTLFKANIKLPFKLFNSVFVEVQHGEVLEHGEVSDLPNPLVLVVEVSHPHVERARLLVRDTDEISV